MTGLNFILICLCLLSIRAHSQHEEVSVTISFEEKQAEELFEYSDNNSWRLLFEDENGMLELHRAGDYTPPFRSPLNIAVLKDTGVGDFTLEVDLKQTGREYGHQDMCLFFGINSPSEYYYVHLATQADQNAHGVFLVNNADRQNITTTTSSGISWGSDWHRVKIVRVVDSGEISVYFDDMTTPVMRAKDHHFADGLIGFGSFDDTGRIDNIHLWGSKGRLIDKIFR